MKKINWIAISLILLFAFSVSHSQKMSRDQYWISLTDKNNSEFSLAKPIYYLSEKAIQRRIKFDIPVSENDLPVSQVYVDSLKSLGLKILGTSKWFNSVLVECSDVSILDGLVNLDFVKEFNTGISNFSGSLSESIEIQDIKFNAEIEYGESFFQSNLLGGIALHNLGFKGKGIDIAVIDAGFYQVDSFEVFRSIRENGQILGVKDFVEPNGDIFAASSHGMSVLSTIAVSESGTFIGTAPESNFYLLRSEYAPKENKVEEAYWVFAAEYADSAGVDIITTSLGYYAFDSTEMNYNWDDLNGTSALVTRAAELAFSKGMIVISSAGNEGNSNWKKITTPADGPNVLAVGSIDTAQRVSGFSSHGYTSDGRVKPDILAVGFQTKLIRSNGETGFGYGTSFAAPQIAGLAACLWQALPEKSYLEIIEAIRQSSNKYASPDSVSGYGIPNFMVALWFLNNLNEAFSGDKINVYPNPFEQSLTLIAPESTSQVNLYSINGTLIHSETSGWLKDEIITLTLEQEVSPGIYFLVVQSENQQIVSKIIRK